MTGIRILALSGGVGGAKLADGLYRVLDPDTLAILVNTGDDFTHLGLPVSPDIDTVVYTLAGLADAERGWGRADEGWRFMEALSELGGPEWFRLGDRDLAMHVMRRSRLDAGESLSQATAFVAGRLGIRAAILPMTDNRLATEVDTDEGVLPFQHYFVARRCEPQVRAVRFRGAEQARPPLSLKDILRGDTLEAIVLCPSNPWLSIDPILAVPGMHDLLRAAGVPVVAVSPLVGGRAVKGPTAKIMEELGLPLTNASIAAHYRGLIDGLVIDEGDDADGVDVPVLRTPTLMRDTRDREALAAQVIDFAEGLAGRRAAA